MIAAAPRVDPLILGFGDTFGTYAGNKLGDTEIYKTAIDSDRLNTSLMTDVVEFSLFEKSIKSFILARLGFPVVRVELTDFQIKTAIDEAITHLDYHAPFWVLQLASFKAQAGINSYVLPTHIAHNLNYCVYKKNLLSLQYQSGSLEFDFFLKYFQDNFVFNTFLLSDFYLLQTNLEMTRKILGQEGSWDVINGNVLLINPTPVIEGEPVILVYRALDSGTMHPYYRNWIQKFSLAVSKGILGEIRGKFSSIPSPGGGAQLNGRDLSAQSEREKEMLLKELIEGIEEPPVFSLF